VKVCGVESLKLQKCGGLNMNWGLNMHPNTPDNYHTGSTRITYVVTVHVRKNYGWARMAEIRVKQVQEERSEFKLGYRFNSVLHVLMLPLCSPVDALNCSAPSKMHQNKYKKLKLV